jgi:hypothetical protein
MMMEAAALLGGGTERLRSRGTGGQQPGGAGGPEITLLTPLISSTNNKGGQPNNHDVLAIDVAIDDNNEEEEQEEYDSKECSSCGTLIQSWRNDLSRVETIVGHVLVRHCLDHSSKFDLLLFGAQWILPLVLLSLLPIHATTAAAILHCQILWFRYAVVVTTTTTTNGSHHGDDDDDDAINLQLQSPYLYRIYYRRVLGCGLATLAVNLPTVWWIVHQDYYDYSEDSEEEFGNDLTRALVVVLANALVFVLVRGGGRLEYVVPTAGIVLIPLLPCLLIMYVVYSIPNHLCHVAAIFSHLEDQYYSGEQFAAREAIDQDRLEHQIAALAYYNDPVTQRAMRTRQRMLFLRRVRNYYLPCCLALAILLIIIIRYEMSLLDIDDDNIIYIVVAAN